MGGVRYGLAGLLLYAWLRLKGAPRPDAEHWRSATIAGALMLLGGNGLVNFAQQSVPSGLTALVVGTVPIWFVTIAWLGPDREKPNLWEIGSIVLGVSGVGLLLSGSLDDMGIGGAGSREVLVGIGALVIATITWSAGSVYSRRARLAKPTLLSTAMMMIGGGALLVIVGMFLGEIGRFDAAAVSTRSLIALAYLIVFGAIIAFSCFVWLFQVVRPALAGTYAYVNPIVAVFLGWALADEAITREMAYGAVLIIGAVVLVERGRARARLDAGGPTNTAPSSEAASPRNGD
jgi:drug/metabolite transporter (DMT)-like permease